LAENIEPSRHFTALNLTASLDPTLLSCLLPVLPEGTLRAGCCVLPCPLKSRPFGATVPCHCKAQHAIYYVITYCLLCDAAPIYFKFFRDVLLVERWCVISNSLQCGWSHLSFYPDFLSLSYVPSGKDDVLRCSLLSFYTAFLELSCRRRGNILGGVCRHVASCVSLVYS
jgi:hypothetical protein